MNKSRRIYTFAVIILVGLGISIQIWASTYWPANFDSDEAINGLIALHATQGEFAPYFYGDNYLGSLEPIISSLFFRIFGSSVLALRSSSLIFYFLFLILNYFLIRRLWGEQVALICLITIAFPGWKMLQWLFRPVAVFGPLLVTVTTIMLLLSNRNKNGAFPVRRNLFIGILGGFGLWLHPMCLYYLVIFAITYVLQTPEWAKLYTVCKDYCRSKLHISVEYIIASITLLATPLFFIVVFLLRPEYNFLVIIALLITFIIGSLVLVLLWKLSHRQRHLISGLLYLGLGTIIGNSPQWLTWVIGGRRPSFGPGAVTDPGGIFSGIYNQAQLLFKELLPLLFGLPIITNIPDYMIEDFVTFNSLTGGQTVLWLTATVIILAAVIYFIFSQKKTIWAVITLSPISGKNKWNVIYTLLFSLLLVIVVFTANVTDNNGIRYLLPSWHAWTLLLALFFSFLIARQRILGYITIGLWIIIVGFGNLHIVKHEWSKDQARWYEPEKIAQIEKFLIDNDTYGGFSDFWSAYALTYLTEERLIFSQYSGVIRIPEYEQEVIEMPRKALIFCPRVQLSESLSLNELRIKLTSGIGSGPIYRRLRNEIQNKQLLDRRNISGWDIWLLTEEL